MADVDISAEAVERRIRELQEAGFDNAAATLRALLAERDTLAAANATLAEEIEEITAIADRGVVLHGEAAEIMSSLEAQRDAATAALAQARRETWARAAEIAERVAIPEDCHGVEAHGRLMAAHAAADAIRSAAAGEEGKS